MVCDPNQQEPARPVVAGAQDEYSANYRQQSDKANPNQVILKRAVDLEIAGVEHKSDSAGCDKKPTNDGD